MDQWSGFKNLEIITLIYEPDRTKIVTFIVHGPFIFSAFATSVFSVCPGSTAILVKKCHATFQRFQNIYLPILSSLFYDHAASNGDWIVTNVRILIPQNPKKKKKKYKNANIAI